MANAGNGGSLLWLVPAFLIMVLAVAFVINAMSKIKILRKKDSEIFFEKDSDSVRVVKKSQISKDDATSFEIFSRKA